MPDSEASCPQLSASGSTPTGRSASAQLHDPNSSTAPLACWHRACCPPFSAGSAEDRALTWTPQAGPRCGEEDEAGMATQGGRAVTMLLVAIVTLAGLTLQRGVSWADCADDFDRKDFASAAKTCDAEARAGDEWAQGNMAWLFFYGTRLASGLAQDHGQAALWGPPVCRAGECVHAILPGWAVRGRDGCAA